MELNMVRLASSCQQASEQVGTDIQNSTAMSVDNRLKQCQPASRQQTARRLDATCYSMQYEQSSGIITSMLQTCKSKPREVSFRRLVQLMLPDICTQLQHGQSF